LPLTIALGCDHPDAVLVHKPTWVANGFHAAGRSTRLVHDLAGVRAADSCCDLVIFDHKASGMNRAALAQLAHEPRRAVWIQWWRDLVAMEPGKRLAEQEHLRSFGAVMRGMDLVLVKEQSLLDEYRQLGIKAHWLDQACPAEMPACEHRERPEWDVLVLGSTGYAQRRADARALADAGYRVLWAGMAGSDPVPPGVEWHPWVHPLKLPELVSRCGVVLGVDWRSDLPGYTSDRTYLACGMGACYVARCAAAPSPQATLAAWIYESTDELIEIVRTAIYDVGERRRRGERSQECVMARHTYAHRAAEIVELVARNGRHSVAQGAILGGECE
jgi:hypothetical protein